MLTLKGTYVQEPMISGARPRVLAQACIWETPHVFNNEANMNLAFEIMLHDALANLAPKQLVEQADFQSVVEGSIPSGASNNTSLA